MKRMITGIWLVFSLFNLNGQSNEVSEMISNLVFDNVQNLREINTSGHEFSPLVVKNDVLFVGANQSSDTDPMVKDNYWDLKFMDTKGETMLDFENLNSGFHEGPASISSDKRSIYFTRNKSPYDMKIFVSYQSENGWSEPIEMPFQEKEFNYCHPSISPDGSTLIFASDIAGGFGKMDLYQTQLINGTWSSPTNLGHEVNSPENEVFPFVHKNRILFFSRNNAADSTGLDIYAARSEHGFWMDEQKLNEPINSDYDDFGVFVSDELDQVYFSSNRPGGEGLDDIYLSDIIHPAEIRSLNILVLNRSDQQGIGQAKVSFVQRDGSEVNYFTDSKGRLQLEIESIDDVLIRISSEGFDTINQLLGSENEYMFLLERAKPKCLAMFGQVVGSSTKPLNKVNVTLVSLKDEQQFQTSTDERGMFDICPPSGPYELVLSRYGFKEKSIKVDLNNFDKLGILVMETEESALKIKDNKISTGTVITLDNIYYDFNKYSIKRGAAVELTELARIMNEYPSMTIMLGAHTDSRGGNALNQKLSEQRADSAKQYLIQLGIDPLRIETIGYGESRIRNNCTDGVNCTEQEHQFNRRTEVRVLSINESVDIKFVNKNEQK